MATAHTPIEELDLFKRFVEVADEIWKVASTWSPLARDTVGKQIIRSADSIGANLVEGDGRHGQADGLHFLVIARASARETRYWIDRARARDFMGDVLATELGDKLTYATRQLNMLIRHRRSVSSTGHIKEDTENYEA